MIRLDRHAICYHCGGRFPVGARALSAMCPHCYKGVELGDHTIKRREVVHRLQTCGTIVVLLKGELAADILRVGGTLTVHGTLCGDVRCSSPVWLGPQAVFQGSLRAPRLIIEDGARLGTTKLCIEPDRPGMGADRPAPAVGSAHPI